MTHMQVSGIANKRIGVCVFAVELTRFSRLKVHISSLFPMPFRFTPLAVLPQIPCLKIVRLEALVLSPGLFV
jgi:hypothetical protein